MKEREGELTMRGRMEGRGQLCEVQVKVRRVHTRREDSGDTDEEGGMSGERRS